MSVMAASGLSTTRNPSFCSVWVGCLHFSQENTHFAFVNSASYCFYWPMESQTSVSKRAPRICG